MAKTQTKRRITVERECVGAVPRATHAEDIDFGPVRITSARLDDGTLINGQQSLMMAIGRMGRPHKSDVQSCSELPEFLAASNLKPYIPEGFEAAPIRYRTLSGQVAIGYDYRVLTTTVLVYTRAFWADALRPNQVPNTSAAPRRC